MDQHEMSLYQHGWLTQPRAEQILECSAAK